MPLARPTFLRVCVADGSQISKCSWCLRSIATSLSEAELKAIELVHECDHADLQRFAPAAARPTTQPTAFQVWIRARGKGAAV